MTLHGSQPDRALHSRWMGSQRVIDPFCLCGPHAVEARLSGAGPDAAPRDADPHKQELLTPLQPGARSALCDDAPSFMRREWTTAQARAEAALALSTEQGFGQFVGALTFQRGQALAAQGQYAEGPGPDAPGAGDKTCRGVGDWAAGRISPRWPRRTAEADSPKAGLPPLLDEALAWLDTHGEDFDGSPGVSYPGGITAATGCPGRAPGGKPASRKPSPWRVVSRPNPWSCAPP